MLWLYKLAVRAWEIRFEEVREPRVEQTEDKIVFIFPISLSRGTIINGGFKCVPILDGFAQRIRVYYGTVSGLAPAGMVFGDTAKKIVAPVGESGVVVLRVDTNDDGVLPDEPGYRFIECKASMPPQNTPAKSYYLQIGSYGTVDGKLTVTPGGLGNGVGDQWFGLCGGKGGEPQFGPA